MIAQSLTFVQHIDGSIGVVNAVVPSPYYAEEAAGIQRVQVLTKIPGPGDHTGWDWWLLDEVIPLPAAPISAGTTAVAVTRKNKVIVGTVLATSYSEIALMLSDGTAGWVDLNVTRVEPVKPAATSAIAIA